MGGVYLRGDSVALLLCVGLAVGGQHSLTLGLRHHLTVVLGGALLLQHCPTLRLCHTPTGLLVHWNRAGLRRNSQCEVRPVWHSWRGEVEQTSSYTVVQTGESDVVQCCLVTGLHSFLCMMEQTSVSTMAQTSSHSGSLKHLLFCLSSAATFTSWQPSSSASAVSAVTHSQRTSDTSG